MNEGKTIIWLSDGPDYPSGFATVGRNVTFRLSQYGHRINFIHCQKAGFIMPFYGNQFDDTKLHVPEAEVMILPGASETSLFGKDMFPLHYGTISENETVDTVVSQMDLYMTSYIAPHHDENSYQWIHYLPVDGHPIPPSWAIILQKIDKIITMTKYGQEIVSDFGFETEYIYHGVDCELYKPRKEVRPEKWEDKFVIGVTNRNQHRKCIPETIEAYKIFQEGKDDVFLYLHMSGNDRMGWRFPDLFKQMGVKSGIGWAANFDPNVGVSQCDMASLYNNFDVLLSTTGGEGFGLTSVEAMACEVPVVITDYTTSSEVVGFGEKDCGGLPINVEYYHRPADFVSGVKRGIPDPKHAAEQLQYLYDNPDERKKLGRQGRERCKRLFDWDNITKQWHDVITE